MIYMTGDVTVIVLETGNLDELKKGRPAKTPDGKVIIAWTPDLPWLANAIVELGDNDAERIGDLIDEAATRPENPTPPRKPTDNGR